MEKKWIKLTKAYDGHPADSRIELDAADADALIAARIGTDVTAEVEADLSGQIKRSFDEFGRVMSEWKAEIVRGLQSTTEAVKGRPRIDAGESEDDKKIQCGADFKTLGNFCVNVARAARKDDPDPVAVKALSDWNSLVRRGVAYGNAEAVDPDGGNLIAPAWSDTIWERARQYNSFADRVNFVPTNSPIMAFPADAETSRADGQRRGGIQGFWEGEADTIPVSKPTFAKRELRLKKLTLLASTTDELISDAPALEGYLNRIAPEELTFKLNAGLIRGTGVGMPLGLLDPKAPSIQVAKETGQAAGTVVPANLAKMWARLYAPCRANAVWLMGQDTEATLYGMFLSTGTSSGALVYLPPGGLSASPYATLFGRPILPIEQCSATGTPGDIILTDPTQILAIRKAGPNPVQTASSIHVRFLTDEMVFRFITRVDAAPAWSAPLTPYNGSATLASTVLLAQR